MGSRVYSLLWGNAGCLSSTLAPYSSSTSSALTQGQDPSPEGPSTQIAGFQGPKTIQSMDFGT